MLLLQTRVYYITVVILFVSEKGDLFGWGNSEYGQLLKPNTTQIYSPIQLQVPQIGPIVDIATGGSFCAALNGKFVVIGPIIVLPNYIIIYRARPSLAVGIWIARSWTQSDTSK